MADEKHGYERADSPPPIPTYEEATSSRHAASRLGPNEVSDDAERQGLLSPNVRVQSDPRRRAGYYQAPSVQSVSDSEDEDDDGGLEYIGRARGRESQDEGLRQTMEEMEILNPEAVEEGRVRSGRSGSRFSKRFYSITHTLSSFHLPRIRWPSWRPDFSSLASRMPSIPEEYRPGWAIIARLFGLMVIVSLVYLLVVSEVVPMGSGFGAQFNPEWVRETAQEGLEGWRIQKNLEYITSYDHIGGTEGSYVLGQWIEGRFKEARMDTYTHDEYWVYMNYAKNGGRKVSIVDPPEKRAMLKLEESNAYNPPRTQTPAYHALSASGNVTGPLIYVNYCHKADFKALWDSGIDVQGAVVLCRYYGTQPDLAMKIKAAQNANVAGVLVYSDPADDGFKEGNSWPDGKWRPEDSVQRGSVVQGNMVMGDVLTPGKSSTKKQARIKKDKSTALPKIPSLPISWKDAQTLLKSLNGCGAELQEEWTGGVPDVGEKWYSGHPDSSPKVNLQNYQDEVDKQRVTNVFGSFKGMEDPAKKIIIGNHRDSWCFGAGDPGSGTAIMLEVVRVLGELRAAGWRPRRTIEFASWDAGEYNNIGSTEHVEANADALRENAIAYLNVDVGITGDELWASGSPIFQHAWHRVLDRTVDPRENKTLKELWESRNARIVNPTARSDFAPFTYIAGTSSLDFGFSGLTKAGKPIHPLANSCYETYDWMSKFVDPGFLYHRLLAEVWILLILELSQEHIVPLKISDYASALQAEGQSFLNWMGDQVVAYDMDILQPLVDALRLLKKRGEEFDHWGDMWRSQMSAVGGFETQGVALQRARYNANMGQFESNLLDLPEGKGDRTPHGLPGREQFKHYIFAPDIENGLTSSVFPAAREAIIKQDWKGAAEAVKKVANILNNAGESLGRS